ncbi:hypothetical protein TNCV_2817301 [Trichonephila clavipes]|nr:hypothetical protein TNCV_2817301 [Trichonephila clavipes]
MLSCQSHVNIFGNEQADNLSKEAQNSQLSNNLTLTDADAISRRKLTFHSVEKHFISELNCNHVISPIIARLRTRHLKGMKISPDGQRSYNTCPHCPDIQLSPNHVFNCPSTLAKLHNIDLKPTGHQLLYTPKVLDIARTVFDTFDIICARAIFDTFDII